MSSYRTVYNSLVYLIWQDRICKRYHDALIERLRSNPIAKHTFVLAAHTKETDFGITSPIAELASKKSFSFLFKEILKGIKFKMPLDRKEEWVNDLLTDWIIKLSKMAFEKLCHEAFFTDAVIRRDFIDKWRTEHNQERYPEKGFQYFDAEKIKPDGSKVSMLEILTMENKSLWTQPEEELSSDVDRYDALVADIRDAHGDDVAKTAEVYLEIYFQQGGKKVKQQKVAQNLGKSRKTISRHIDKIEKFLREKMKKN